MYFRSNSEHTSEVFEAEIIMKYVVGVVVFLVTVAWWRGEKFESEKMVENVFT